MEDTKIPVLSNAIAPIRVASGMTSIPAIPPTIANGMSIIPATKAAKPSRTRPMAVMEPR